MVRSDIPESVAMKISGHKTRSVFERYNISEAVPPGPLLPGTLGLHGIDSQTRLPSPRTAYNSYASMGGNGGQVNNLKQAGDLDFRNT